MSQHDVTPQDRSEAERGLARHAAGFLGSGIAGLTVDMGLLALLTRLGGLSPYTARPVSIFCAIIASWLCHRRFTFAVTAAPSLHEFMRFAAVAWSAAAVNYAFYAAILFLLPGLAPEAAMFCSSLVAMAVSYAGMRFAVFVRS